MPPLFAAERSFDPDASREEFARWQEETRGMLADFLYNGEEPEAFTYIEKAYAIAGAPDKVTHDIHDGAHRFRAEVPMQWFEEYLSIQ